MLKVTTRYLSSHFIPPFTIGFFFFVAFLNTFYMFRIISLIVNKDVDILTVLGMVLSLSVSFFPMAIPLAIFFATIYTLNKLSEDSEIIAMRSFGFTKFQIYKPILVLSLIIASSMAALNSIYIPKANAKFRNTILKLSSSGMLASIKPGQFFTDIPNVTLFADKVSEDGMKFEDVFLHLRGNKDQRIIMAEKGELRKLDGTEHVAPSIRLILEKGNIVKTDQKGEELEKIVFDNYDFPVMKSTGSFGSLDKDSMKTNDELWNIIHQKKEIRTNLITNKEKTNDFENKLKEADKSLAKTEIELYTRYMTFVQIVLFAMLAFSLGVKKGRGATGNNTGKAILIMIGYYGLYFFLVSLAQRGQIGTMMTIVLPILMLLGFGLYYFKKLDWAS